MMRRSTETQEKSRRGALFVIVIVCLIITNGLTMAMTRRTLTLYRQRQQAHEHRQLTVLADDALRQAVKAYLENPAYDGQYWQVEPESWSIQGTARITTTVQPGLTIQVVTELEQGQDITARVTKTYSLTPQIPGETNP